MATQTIKKTKYRVKKNAKGSDKIICNICGGRGYIANWHKKKK